MRKVQAAMALAALAGAAAIGFGTRSSKPETPADVPAGSPAVPASGPGAASTMATAPAASLPAAPPASEPLPKALGSGEPPNLRADAGGHLVVDAHTRDELERLLALNDRAESLALLRSLESTLPPIAYREALDAYYAFQNYQAAIAQAYPPGQPLGNENEAAAQLDGLHALRVSMLGSQAASAYFGEEESIARRVITWMQANPMPGVAFEEKVMRAQEATADKP